MSLALAISYGTSALMLAALLWTERRPGKRANTKE